MQDFGKLLLRLGVGGLLFLHGVKNFGGIEGIHQLLAAKDLPEALAYGVYVGETVAPVFLVLGLFPRLAGLAIAVTMAFGIYLAPAGDLLALNADGGLVHEVPALFLCGGLVAALIGPGRFAIKLGRSAG